MALYAIADLHLSLGTDKPMDVFRGWENYVERLEKNWRALVTEEDIKAEFKHGLLKLFVPKKEAKPAVEQKKTISIEG